MAYEKMKAAVRKTVPELITVKVIPAQVNISLKATKPAKQGALKALDAIEELLGPRGRHWVQGQYHSLGAGFEAFCLSGAFNKVDGKHEAIARAAISIAIAELFPDRTDDLEPGNIEAATVAAESTIVTFNDYEYTTWSDVKKVLRRARKILST